MSLALLLNSRSRKARKDPKLVESIERMFGDRGRLITSKSESELPEALADIYRTRPDILFICGGDGTLRQTLTYLVSSYGADPLPKIAILRGGTMNTVATSLGLYRPVLPHLKLLLAAQDRGVPFATVKRRLLRVNDYYGFIFGLGGFSRFIEFYSKGGDPTPLHGARLISQTTISALLGGPLAKNLFQNFRVNLWRDAKPYLVDATVTNVSAATIRHIGFHFKPYVGAEEPDGSLGLLIFRTPPHHLLKHTIKMLLGEPFSDPNIIQVPAHDVLLKVEEPMRPMLDGDILKESKEFLLQSGPSLDLIVG